MPVDYNLLGPPPRINTPFENLSQILQVRNQQQAAQGLAERRQSIAEERRQKAEQARQAAQSVARIKALFSRVDPVTGQPKPPTMEELASEEAMGPEAAVKFFDGLEALKTKTAQNQEQQAQRIARIAAAVLGAKPELRPLFYEGAIDELTKDGTLKPGQAPPKYNEDWVNVQLRRAMSVADQVKANAPPTLTQRDPTKDLIDPQGNVVKPGTPAAPEPPKLGSFEDYVDRFAKARGIPPQAITPGLIEQARKQYGQADDRPRVNVSVTPQGIEAPEDPNSQDIMSQAGLSYNAFLAATGRMSLLPRDQATRNRASQEVQQWARSRGRDVSTLASQYKAYNDVLEANIERYNRTQMAEGEIKADVSNLLGAAKESGLGDVRAINAAQQWLRGELNDPGAAQYAFFLNQLTNDIALYNAASQGRAALEADLKEAKDVVRRGIATGSLQGMETAITKSVEKMGEVLEGGVNRARKNVWDLFGVGDKYQPTTRAKPGGGTAPAAGGRIRVVGPNGETGTVPDDGKPLPPGWKRATG